MGARPMQRLIQDTIRRALADELLFGRLVDGGRLTVDIDDEEKVVLDIQPNKRSDKPKAEQATA
jgi:ATP-dependent Clp protease ATP-binding subunit ClpA